MSRLWLPTDDNCRLTRPVAYRRKVRCPGCCKGGGSSSDPWPIPFPIPGGDYSGTLVACNMQISGSCPPPYPTGLGHIRQTFYMYWNVALLNDFSECCPDATIGHGSLIPLGQTSNAGIACQWAGSAVCKSSGGTRTIGISLTRNSANVISCGLLINRFQYTYDLIVSITQGLGGITYTFRNTDFFGHVQQPQQFNFVSYGEGGFGLPAECEPDNPYQGDLWIY